MPISKRRRAQRENARRRAVQRALLDPEVLALRRQEARDRRNEKKVKYNLDF